jgi:hypothetical protein
MKMRMQLNYETKRREFLLGEWDRAVGDYAYDLEVSKNRENKELFKLFKDYNRGLGHRLMLAYLMRCKLKHSFAFFHFRKMVPD